jgi:cytochrome P450
MPRMGATVTLEALEEDPYRVYDLLRRHEPISRIEAIGMWYVVNYDDVQAILLDDSNFVVGTPGSLLYDTFGSHMLTVDGTLHTTYRNSFRGAFTVGNLQRSMETWVGGSVARLIDDFPDGGVELRGAFARILPVQSILRLFGLSDSAASDLRTWYDGFEAALANFTWDQSVRDTAHGYAAAFRGRIQEEIGHVRARPTDSLLSDVANASEPDRLSDEEIQRNASIIFFGGISTVEALILNSVYALCTHPAEMARVIADPSLLPAVIEETIRWRSPVQTATRHVVREVEINGVTFASGDTVNCIIAAANRDPAVFQSPDRFCLGRPNAKRHLGFASGPHFCLGSHLARLQARVALEGLLGRLENLHLDPARPAVIRGHEFHQPHALHLAWDASR